MRDTVSADVLSRIRLVWLDLPEVIEEKAWVGIRWCVGKKNFAHVLSISEGWPPAYAKAAGTAGPACVATFRLSRERRAAARFARAPFFLGGLFRDSYRVLAPRKLLARMSE